MSVRNEYVIPETGGVAVFITWRQLTAAELAAAAAWLRKSPQYNGINRGELADIVAIHWTDSDIADLVTVARIDAERSRQ